MGPLTALAEKILADAKRIDAYQASQGKPPTSVDYDTLGDLPPELDDVRNEIADTTQALHQLAARPKTSFLEILFSYMNFISLRAIYEYKLPHLVPLEGCISFEDVARLSGGLDLDRTRRFLRHAMMQGIFREEPVGFVRHTAISRLLVNKSGSFDHIGNMTMELGPAGGKVLEAMRRPGWSMEEPNHTGYNLHHNTDLPIYLELEKHPERARRFGATVKYLTSGPEFDVLHFVNELGLHELDNRTGQPATIVDIGGGIGQVTAEIAKATKNLRVVLQDLPVVIEQAEQQLSGQLNASEMQRVQPMVHDFFTPQPIVGADVYFLRWIMHNWSDKYCLTILRNLLPALKPGAKIFLGEYVLPEAASRTWSMERHLDMLMMVAWNAKERTEQDWRELFARADDRFQFVGVRRRKRVELQFIEVVYTGKSAPSTPAPLAPNLGVEDKLESHCNGVHSPNAIQEAKAVNTADSINGVHEPERLSGVNGVNGASDIHDPEAVNGINGINGVNGVHGVHKPEGLNGVNGVNGVHKPEAFRGVNGVNGVHKPEGVNGINGVHGDTMLNGMDDIYKDISTNRVNKVHEVKVASGVNGVHEAIVANGVNGVNMVHKAMLVNGTNAIYGINKVNGVNGMNGVHSIDGIGGVNGCHRIKGINGDHMFSKYL